MSSKSLVVLKTIENDGNECVIGAVMLPDDKDRTEFLKEVNTVYLDNHESNLTDDESMLDGLRKRGYEICDPPEDIIVRYC